MTSPGVRALFAAQAARLGRRLKTLSTDDPALSLCLHTLKGAALAAGEDATARACHAAEQALLTGHESGTGARLPQALVALFACIDLTVQASHPSLDDLRLALRTGFAEALRQSGGEATLRLTLDAAWLPLADFLLDTLPILLGNALVHGGEPPAQRQVAGKPTRLQVTVRARALAGRLSLVVADDGRGRPRERTVPADLLSGRGWGVAAVRAAVAGLPDGHLAFRGSPGRGSCVRIVCRAE